MHPGDVCVRAMSGRQIERFFRVNPDLADDYAGDAFWERRAIAARYVSQQKLMPLIADPDEVVRRVLAYRLPIEALDPLISDPDREVRITVADRVPLDRLERLAADPDYLVRQYVARRIAPGRLFRLIRDPDRQVRATVAERLPLESLGLMRDDPEPEVRIKVAERIRPAEANGLLRDPDWRVRLRLAERLPIDQLAPMIDDIDPDVRAVARARIADMGRRVRDDRHHGASSAPTMTSHAPSLAAEPILDPGVAVGRAMRLPLRPLRYIRPGRRRPGAPARPGGAIRNGPLGLAPTGRRRGSRWRTHRPAASSTGPRRSPVATSTT